MSELGPRISVIGCSGSGKTWTASRVSTALGIPHTELDALRHGRKWTEVPDDEFRAAVRGAAAEERWVIDGNYTELAREIIWSRASAVVWLDYPRSIVMRQVVSRSAARWALRRELWNGNRERLRDWLRWYHPIRWAWSQHGPKRVRDEAMLNHERWSHLKVVRLSSRSQTKRWLETIS